jgi:hypothetical protein
MQGGEELAEQMVVSTGLLAHGQQALDPGLGVQAMLEGVVGDVELALGGGRSVGLAAVLTVGLHLLGGGLAFLGDCHRSSLFKNRNWKLEIGNWGTRNSKIEDSLGKSVGLIPRF